jgi:hypothetical protein
MAALQSTDRLLQAAGFGAAATAPVTVSSMNSRGRQHCSALAFERYLPAFAMIGAWGLFSWCAGLSAVLSLAAASSLVAMSGPGILLLSCLPAKSSGKLATIAFGAVIGLAASRLAIAMMSWLLGFAPASTLVLLAGVISLAAVYRRQPRVEQPATDQGKVFHAIAALSVATLLPAAAVFSRVGALTEEGYAFVPYFNLDFLNHLAVTAELAKGLPPENPYFAGFPLRYYWLFHVWPAVLMKLGAGTAQGAVTALVPLNLFLFVACLLLIRRPPDPLWPRVVCVAIAWLAPSYVGLLVLGHEFAPSGMEPAFRTVTAGYYLLSHSWFRDVLYEPHALGALAMLLAALHLWDVQRTTGSALAGTVAGCMVGAALLTDASVGLIGTAAGGIVVLAEYGRDGRLREILFPASGLVLVGVAGACLGMIVSEGGSLRVALHPMSRLAVPYLLVELGPLLLLGAMGLLPSRTRTARSERWQWMILLGVSLAFGFAVEVTNAPNMALRKGEKLSYLSLVMLATPAIQRLWQSGPGPRAARRWMVSLAIAAGTVTSATDVIQYFVPGKVEGATYLRPAEKSALEWLRSNTDLAAVVQDIAEVQPGRGYMATMHSNIAALGERRTAWGCYLHPVLFRVPEDARSARLEDLVRLFEAESASDVARAAATVGIDYLYVDHDRSGPHDAVGSLVRAGGLRREGCWEAVCIYKVTRRSEPRAEEGGT